MKKKKKWRRRGRGRAAVVCFLIKEGKKPIKKLKDKGIQSPRRCFAERR